MSASQIAGYIILALPFIVLTVFMVKETGWKGTMIVWGLFLGTLAIVALGAYLVGK